MHFQLVPPFLSNLLPPLVADISNYPLRNRNNYVVPKSRLNNTELSFISSTVRLWNNLENSTRNIDSLSQFKKALTPIRTKSPCHFQIGDRKTSIIHRRLRHNCSILNYDLYRSNLVNDPCCRCGNACENVYHYFYDCPLYTKCRENLQRELMHFRDLNLNDLLFGSRDLYLEENSVIFSAVHRVIRASERFSTTI